MKAQWTPAHEKRFHDLAILEALQTITTDEHAELEKLSRLFLRAHPPSAEELRARRNHTRKMKRLITKLESLTGATP